MMSDRPTPRQTGVLVDIQVPSRARCSWPLGVCTCDKRPIPPRTLDQPPSVGDDVPGGGAV